jgi:biotin carboxyl carrier protein
MSPRIPAHLDLERSDLSATVGPTRGGSATIDLDAPAPLTPPQAPTGEHLDVLERVVVSPATGTFTALPPETVTTEGEIVLRGQAVGTVNSPGGSVTVESPFTGFLMGIIALPGERVRQGEPVAWLRATA